MAVRKVVSPQIDQAIYDEIRLYAKTNRRSIARSIEVLLEFALQNVTAGVPVVSPLLTAISPEASRG